MSEFWLGFIALPAGAVGLALAGFSIWGAYWAVTAVLRRVYITGLEPPVDMETGEATDVWELNKRSWMAARIMTERRAFTTHVFGVTVAITMDARSRPAYHLSSASQIIQIAFNDALKRRKDRA